MIFCEKILSSRMKRRIERKEKDPPKESRSRSRRPQKRPLEEVVPDDLKPPRTPTAEVEWDWYMEEIQAREHKGNRA